MMGDQETSIRYRRDAIALMQAAFPHGHPIVASFSVNLATALQRGGRYEEAEDILLKTLPMQIEMFGEHASDVLWTLVTLCGTERRMHRLDDALAHGKRAYDIAVTFADDNDWKAYAFENYGSTLTEANRASEALPILEKALAIDKCDAAGRSQIDRIRRKRTRSSREHRGQQTHGRADGARRLTIA